MPKPPGKPHKCRICQLRFQTRDGWNGKSTCVACQRVLEFLDAVHKSRTVRKHPRVNEQVARYAAIIRSGGRIFE